MTAQVEVGAETIPQVLRDSPQWVCWRLEEVQGRQTKVPYDAKVRRKASSTAPETWATFDQAVAAWQGSAGFYLGVGFVFRDGGGIVGVDLDHCLKDGRLHPDAERIVKTLDSYTEVSPSGDGLHVILLGRKPVTACSRPKMPWGGECAIYEKSRFFVMTGQRFADYPEAVQPRQEQLSAVCAELWPSPEEKARRARDLHAAGRSVRQIAEELNISVGSISAYLKGAEQPIEHPTEHPPKAVEQGTEHPADQVFDGGVQSEKGAEQRCSTACSVPKPGCSTPCSTPNPGVQSPVQPPVQPAVQSMTDDAIIEKASASRKSGEKFKALWAGRWNDYFNSASEADSSVVFTLAFYTKDAAQIDRMFRGSGLMREKWDEFRGEETYGEKTIRKALSGVTGQYAPRRKRLKRGEKAATVAVARPATGAGELRNHEIIEVVNSKGETREAIRVISLDRMRRGLLGPTGDWPRRVGSMLFFDDGGKVRYLKDRDALFAWAQERMPVFWAAGSDLNGQSLLTKAEFVAHLQAMVTDYIAVEEMPHEPVMAGHYYAWRPPVDYVPTGEYFQQLLDFFNNPETEADRVLLRAAFLTPAWGGLPGKRPAFVIMAPDRGYGKSTLAEVIGMLYGGYIELSLTESAEDKLVTRLLTPDALTRRVVRVDNIKRSYGSELLEALITAPVISGHRMYCGEACRPNTLTYILTGNALKLSRDLAERAFIVRMKKPPRRKGWDDAVRDYVTVHRLRILADIAAELKKPPCEEEASDRWMSWVTSVLVRCTTEPAAIVEFNQERRGKCDEDRDECDVVMEAIDKYVAEQNRAIQSSLASTGESIDGSLPEWAFVSSTDMTDILSMALHEKLSAKAARQRLDAHIEAGRLSRVRQRRTNTCNGYDVLRPRDGE